MLAVAAELEGQESQGSSGEHIPETAATEGSPAGCEAGRWAQVIPSLVFHHIHWMGKGREDENERAQTPCSTGPTPPRPRESYIQQLKATEQTLCSLSTYAVLGEWRKGGSTTFPPPPKDIHPCRRASTREPNQWPHQGSQLSKKCPLLSGRSWLTLLGL